MHSAVLPILDCIFSFCNCVELQVFGSIDSEQSVPRTAPIATPEHDSSLADLMNDASNNNKNANRCGRVVNY